ncbi:hypothetical protein KI387_031750 [Taxus chinensis]|uniref:Glutathione synthase substrate-binding domain-containing protein n=1 Tax=Taxus chinensis TaxID=29808 RepID=A0AA38F2X3_TAXCH|nr:hypothetical protein KI387_031750 [Taxus chinensis]
MVDAGAEDRSCCVCCCSESAGNRGFEGRKETREPNAVKEKRGRKALSQRKTWTRRVDDFTARLLDIHSKTMEDGFKQEIRLGLHRSDYMLDTETGSLLQIELNTISSSFAGLGCLISQLHRHLINHFGEKLSLDSKRVPENTAMKRYAETLAYAWKEYNDLRGEHVVAVVYFRAGYTPVDYPSEAEWRARLMLEKSSAIKCPSISYHLAGSKKIQQELAKPNVLERCKEHQIFQRKRIRAYAINLPKGTKNTNEAHGLVEEEGARRGSIQLRKGARRQMEKGRAKEHKAGKGNARDLAILEGKFVEVRARNARQDREESGRKGEMEGDSRM